METLRAATFAMGTRFEFVLVGFDAVRLRSAVDAAIDEIAIWDGKLSLFRRDSVVSHINRQAAQQAMRIETEIFELLRLCRSIHDASSGAFDVSIAPLMKHLGLHDSRSAAPSGETIGMDRITLDETRETVSFIQEDTAIDLGAIGKGVALDRAAEVLRDAGIEQALIHGGTSAVLAIGAPPGRRGWGIRIHDPCLEVESDRETTQRHAAPPVVYLRDAALCVSARHGREVEKDGERIGHVIDPRSGQPIARSGFAAVVCESAALADAWSTALLVLGRRPDDLDDSITSILPAGAHAAPDQPYTVEGRLNSMIERAGTASSARA